MNWRIIIMQRFSHKNESSDPLHKAPQPGGPALGRQAPRTFGFQETQWAVGNRDYLVKGSQKISYTSGPKAEAVI